MAKDIKSNSSIEDASPSVATCYGVWISVANSKPKLNELVLVYTPNLDSGRNITTIRLLTWFKQCEATHWMPIPKTP